MRIATTILLLAACERASGVETSPGSGSAASAAPTIIQPDASLVTTPNDAAVVANVPADAAVADAAVARRDARVRDTVALDEAATIEALAALSGNDTGNDMSKRRPGTDLGRQLDEIREGGRQVVVVGGGGGRGVRGDARVGTGTGTVGNGGAVATGSGRKDIDDGTPNGRISVTNKQAYDESNLAPELVLAKIQSVYMAGFKRCYKKFLKQEPAARGKITLTITVNESGRSVGGKASGFASEIDACVVGQMAMWSFPVPRDRDGEPTSAAFGITFALVPD